MISHKITPKFNLTAGSSIPTCFYATEGSPCVCVFVCVIGSSNIRPNEKGIANISNIHKLNRIGLDSGYIFLVFFILLPQNALGFIFAFPIG